MTEQLPDDDLGARLRESLRQRADSAPSVDLLDSSLRGARRVRRRRRAVAAAAVVALAVPVWGLVRYESSTQGPPVADNHHGGAFSTSVDLASLPKGPRPALAYVAGRLFHSASGKVTPIGVRRGEPVADVVATPSGLFVWRRLPAGTTSAAYPSGAVRLSVEGMQTTLPRGIASMPTLDDHGAAAWAVYAGSSAGKHSTSGHARIGLRQDAVVEASEANGQIFGWTPTGSFHVQHLVYAHAGVVLFNAVRSGQSVVASTDVTGHSGADPAVITTPWPRLRYVLAVSTSSNLMIGADRGTPDDCTSVMAYPTARSMWTTCQWRPVEFSPDGSQVLAIQPGLAGSHTVAVLDSRTGRVLHIYRTSGAFGRITYEDAGHLDMVVTQSGSVAIVRCPVAPGRCELAAPRRPAVTGTATYQITAQHY